MKLGLELLARRPAELRLGTYFETWLATAAGATRRSLGRDDYHLGLTIAAGNRLAATGRTHICQLDLEAAELGRNQARPTLLVPVEPLETERLLWAIRTNLFLSLSALLDGATARLCRDARQPLGFGFDHPLAPVQEVAPGRYLIEVTNLLFA